jgi:ferrous iron transport protein B
MSSIPLVALVGNPNAGKSALFNALTGARQKTGNYPGVTVERHAGRIALDDGRPVELVDLPGTYSLSPASPDEAVTRDVVLGKQAGERIPSALIIVVDAGNLDNHLRFAIELIETGVPSVVALNMIDLAERDGLTLSAERLSAELGVPVVETVAVRKRGLDALKDTLAPLLSQALVKALPTPVDQKAITQKARAAAKAAIISEQPARRMSRNIDAITLHPIFGPILLFALLFIMFQLVYQAAEGPVTLIEGGLGWVSDWVKGAMPDTVLRSLITDGVIAGVGAVIVFLPQILVLFAFILVLEMTGYMVRAAFIMDRLMAGVGLSGRAFIPLLSSFACAIPGIMATRTIEDPKDRLTTILIAPLMTCSARLPVYAVVIGAVIPNTAVLPGVGLQGLVLFALYITGILGAMLVAWVLRRTVVQGKGLGFIMEMPRYQLPHIKDLLLGLWQRAAAFLKRAGTIIALTTIVLWALSSFPKAPEGQSQLDYSIAGRIGGALEPIVAPIGFNRDMALSIIPAMAAREVAVAALATTYAIDSEDEAEAEDGVRAQIAKSWTLPMALSFLVWFVFAPQCISTIAVVRRETNGWKWPAFMVVYLFALAYCAAGATYWLSRFLWPAL